MRPTLHAPDRSRCGIPLCLLAVLLPAACQQAPPTGPTPPANYSMHAAAPVVNSDADPGDGVCDADECTLREAIAAAAPGDEITFDPSLSGSTIVLNGTQLSIVRDLTITGPGASLLTVDANLASRLLTVNAGTTVRISGLTLTRGFNALGGGISGINTGGNLTLEDCEIRDNQSSGGSVIRSLGALTFRRCSAIGNTGANLILVSAGSPSISVEASTLRQNAATSNLLSLGPAGAIQTSTISGNTTGRYLIGAGTIRNSTITDNTSSLATLDRPPPPPAVSSSILAGNSGPLCDASFVSGGQNVLDPLAGSEDICSPTFAPDDQFISAAALVTTVLSPLADNGGPTWTHALLDPAVTGLPNPALDKGSCTASGVTTDQRGDPRPTDFPAVADTHDGCDVGAFELQLPVAPPEPCTLADLAGRVDALREEGVLNKGQSNALGRKLTQAEKHASKGKTADAQAALEEFVQQVSALQAEGVLTEEQAAALSGCAAEAAAGLAA